MIPPNNLLLVLLIIA